MNSLAQAQVSHPPEPKIDRQALERHVSAIADLARDFFCASIAADPRVAGWSEKGPLGEFEMAVELACNRALRDVWDEVAGNAQRVANEAVARAFAERAS